MLVVDENTVNKLVKITPEKSWIVCLILVEVCDLVIQTESFLAYYHTTNFINGDSYSVFPAALRMKQTCSCCGLPI